MSLNMQIPERIVFRVILGLLLALQLHGQTLPADDAAGRGADCTLRGSCPADSGAKCKQTAGENVCPCMNATMGIRSCQCNVSVISWTELKCQIQSVTKREIPPSFRQDYCDPNHDGYISTKELAGSSCALLMQFLVANDQHEEMLQKSITETGERQIRVSVVLAGLSIVISSVITLVSTAIAYYQAKEFHAAAINQAEALHDKAAALATTHHDAAINQAQNLHDKAASLATTHHTDAINQAKNLHDKAATLATKHHDAAINQAKTLHDKATTLATIHHTDAIQQEKTFHSEAKALATTHHNAAIRHAQNLHNEAQG